MGETPLPSELSKTITIFQGLLFERAYGKGKITSVVTDIGDEDLFFAATLFKNSDRRRKGDYVFTGTSGSLTGKDILKIQGSMSLNELIAAAEHAMKEGIAGIDQNYIKSLYDSAKKGSRVLTSKAG